MGVVYQAQDPAGRVVALKLLVRGREASPAQRSRFEREANALAQLRHPHVVQLLDRGTFQGAPYFVMEYVAGGSLADRIEAGPMAPSIVVSLGRQLAGALAATHALGLLHRDVKPDNVLLGASGQVQLTDFGLVKDLFGESELEQLTRTGSLLGTPGFWAPEQARGRRDLDARVDVYGLGATLYAALAGHPPFVAPTPLEVIRLAQAGPPPPLRSLRPELDPALSEVIERCMQQDPAERWRNALELEAALEECAFRAPERPHGTARGALLGVAAASVVFVALGLGLWGAQRNETPQLAAPSPSPSASAASTPAPLSTPDDDREQVKERAEQLLAQAEAAREGGRPGEARELARQAAELGLPQAMLDYGQQLTRGEDPAERAEAVAWFRRAAELGHLDALYNLASCLLDGIGVEPDRAQGIELFNRAAERGHVKANYNLGVIYGKGDLVARDELRAATYYQRAARGGHAGAAWTLYGYYSQGRGVPRDDRRALALLERAAGGGHAVALHELGELLRHGSPLVEVDLGRALRCYEQSVQAGFLEALVALAFMHSSGQGVPRSPTRALQLLGQGARAGDPACMASLGAMLLQAGKRKAAAMWWRKAAKAGHLGGIYGHALSLVEGYGEAGVDLPEAKRWLQRLLSDKSKSSYSRSLRREARQLLARIGG